MICYQNSLVGEAMHVWFPNGVGIGGMMNPIIPGAYSVAGAAAFAGKKLFENNFLIEFLF